MFLLFVSFRLSRCDDRRVFFIPFRPNLHSTSTFIDVISALEISKVCAKHLLEERRHSLALLSFVFIEFISVCGTEGESELFR